MLLLGLLLMTSMCRGGGGQGLFTKNPESTLAVVGDNVTLSCTLSVRACVPQDPRPNYMLYWRAKPGAYISNCGNISLLSKQDRYSIYSPNGYEWNLKIRNVLISDSRRYQCDVYSFVTPIGRSLSSLARLTVVDPINTEVRPPFRRSTEKQMASFRCLAHAQLTDSYAWFMNTNGQWIEIPNSDNFQLSEDKASLTIQRLRARHNGSQIACEVIRESTSITRQRQTALLIVDPREESTTTAQTTESPTSDGISPTPQNRQDGNVIEPSPRDGSEPSISLDGETGLSTSQLPSGTPVTQSAAQSDSDHTNLPSLCPACSEWGNSSLFIVAISGWAVSILLVFIAVFVYFFVFKGRYQQIPSPRRNRRTTGKEATGSTDSRVGDTYMDLLPTEGRCTSSGVGRATGHEATGRDDCKLAHTYMDLKPMVSGRSSSRLEQASAGQSRGGEKALTLDAARQAVCYKQAGIKQETDTD